ncbi:MAG: 50S ribosomal protein L5 [Hadesarchaea archaeon]|nr:50S ribosomal protein L5 [Hadesarchaea archaeon]
MREIRVGKASLNIGVGMGGKKLSKAEGVLEEIVDQEPVRTYAKRTNKDFEITQGTPVGCKVTLRGEKAVSVLDRLLKAVGREINESSIDRNGNFSFGVDEHIEISGMEYNPEIGIYGLDVSVSLVRPGFRIKNRRRNPSKIPESHQIDKSETIQFLEENFSVEVV